MSIWKQLLLVMPIIFLLCGCSQDSLEMHEGYYTAEAASFDEDGWKEFMTIYVSNGKIVTVEYNAKDISGFIKSWDVEHMRMMKAEKGTYPNKYARLYAAELLNKQDPLYVTPLPGAEDFHSSFQLLAKAVIAQAKVGDKKVTFVDLSAADKKS